VPGSQSRLPCVGSINKPFAMCGHRIYRRTRVRTSRSCATVPPRPLQLDMSIAQGLGLTLAFFWCYALERRRADMFVTIGLDLELWVPALLDKAGNSDVIEGPADM